LTRSGATGVARLEAATRTLRALDYEHGGGACASAVLAQLSTGRRMLDEVGAASGDVAVRLHVALADLHNLAGWISFDIGRAEAAQAHFRAALDLAEGAGNHSLAANVHYRLGRVHLHHDRLDDALREFDASGHEAVGTGSELELALVDANRAWVHAKRGDAAEAERLLARAQDGFADPDRAPDWARFFTAADLTGMTGTVHATLAEAGDVQHVEKAVPALNEAIDAYGEDMARSRAFSMIELAVSTLLAGDLDAGVEAGCTAVSHAAPIRSARMVDRMRPLHRAALGRPNHDGARELVLRIEAFSAN
jgi:tetratricopeptide (TPR) repeat protein